MGSHRFLSFLFLYLHSVFYLLRNCSISPNSASPKLNSICLLNPRFFSPDFTYASFRPSVSRNMSKWCIRSLLFLSASLLGISLFFVRNRCKNRRIPQLRNHLLLPRQMEIIPTSFQFPHFLEFLYIVLLPVFALLNCLAKSLSTFFIFPISKSVSDFLRLP